MNWKPFFVNSNRGLDRCKSCINKRLQTIAIMFTLFSNNIAGLFSQNLYDKKRSNFTVVNLFCDKHRSQN